MIGHNRGPGLEPGTSWRRHCWTQARARLLPTLPIEVVRLRVKRAAEIGLGYHTYASIRAASGQDVIALLFSTNALRLLHPCAQLSAERRAKLTALSATGLGALANAPLTPDTIRAIAPALFDTVAAAPPPFAPWADTRRHLLTALAPQKWPADRVVMIGDTSEERDWTQAARLAWYLPADLYFSPPS